MATAEIQLEIPAERQLPTTGSESRAYWMLRARRLNTMTSHALRSMRVQLVSIGFASLVMWVGLYILFQQGFQFVAGQDLALKQSRGEGIELFAAGPQQSMASRLALVEQQPSFLQHSRLNVRP